MYRRNGMITNDTPSSYSCNHTKYLYALLIRDSQNKSYTYLPIMLPASQGWNLATFSIEGHYGYRL